jgi:transcriptional regulator with XRE-family HTH domain
VKRNHPDETRDILARNVRLLRAERGLSQEALAFESGINRTYLSDIERGRRNVSIDNLSRIAAALNVPVWQLLQPRSD